MGLLARITAYVRGDDLVGPTEQRHLDLQSPTLAGLTPGQTVFMLPPPPSLSSNDPLAVSAAWRCVVLLADAVAGLKLHTYRDGVRIDAPPVIAQPDPAIPRSRFLRRLVVDLLVRGNGYAVMGRERAGWPQELRWVPAKWVRPILDSSGLVVVGWDVGSPPMRFPAYDVLHVPYLEVDGSAIGIGPLDAARQDLELAGYQAERAHAQARDDASFPFALTTDQALTKEQADQLLDQWTTAHYRGSQTPAILSRGLSITAGPTGLTAEQMQFLQSRQFSVAEIARFFGIPPSILNAPVAEGGSQVYTNVEQEAIGFLRWTMDPLLVRVEDALTMYCLPRGVEARFDRDSLLRADAKSQAEVDTMLLSAGVLAVDEVRSSRNLPPLAGAFMTPEVER